MNFLNGDICKELRNVVNSSKIFYCDDQEKSNYNLICAVIDRVDDSVAFFNKLNDYSQNLDDIMLFMVHSCIVIDAVKEIMKKLDIIDEQRDEKNYFKHICTNKPLYLVDSSCPTDIKFFEYLRALVFAHPFETNRADFLREKNEIHYSPFLLSNVNNVKKDCIGIVIYSSKNSETKTIYVAYDNLKAFIKSRYEQLILLKNE